MQRSGQRLMGALALASIPQFALAQQRHVGVGYRTLEEAAQHETFVMPPRVPDDWSRPDATLASTGGAPRPVIMLTGYWPPTNEMVRPFSQSPTQNPGGWIGADWEGRGYDVVSFFPEFNTPNCGNCGQGSGDFEVDYQDTSADFWSITPATRPVAIITFSRGYTGLDWEIEMNNGNWLTWTSDYTSPVKPTPTPPDASYPVEGIRNATLPVQDIVDNVDALGLGLDVYICFNQDSGDFLSGYLGYHGVWYQDIHKTPGDPDWCLAAGHVHVGSNVDWNVGRLATEETIRTVIDHLDATIAAGCQAPATFCATAPNSVGPGATISAEGQPSLTLNEFALRVDGLPADQPGLFYFGANEQAPPLPFGDGLRCIASPTVRLNPPGLSDAGGVALRPLDFTRVPTNGLSIGQTWRFQHWYRDPDAAGAGFNLSDGIEVLLCP